MKSVCAPLRQMVLLFNDPNDGQRADIGRGHSTRNRRMPQVPRRIPPKPHDYWPVLGYAGSFRKGRLKASGIHDFHRELLSLISYEGKWVMTE
jgi:hypothetical protein